MGAPVDHITYCLVPGVIVEVKTPCPFGGHESRLSIDIDDYSVHCYSCSECSLRYWAQVQECLGCEHNELVSDLASFQTGIFTCSHCRRVQRLSPWTKVTKPSPQKSKPKTPFWLKVFKKALFKKGPVLAHDHSAICPDCNMDSIFWEIGNGARMLCSMCDKEIETPLRRPMEETGKLS